MKRKTLLLGLLLVALAMLFVVSTAFAAGPSPAPVCTDRIFQGGPEEQPADDQVKMFFPYLVSPCGNPVVKEVPYEDAWANSGHNDKTAVAFNYWNSAGGIPVGCAKCHSTPGYRDFLGDDGTEAGVVNNIAALGTTVECVACHNSVTPTKTSVKFPSGVTLENLGGESRCMECHQGRSSGPQVEAYIAGKNLPDMDTPSATLSFQNIHYFAAAATQYGAEVHGGYEYAGMAYDTKFPHVANYNTCFECHSQHTLEIKYSECATCHPGATDATGLDTIRMNGSLGDYDADGDVEEGIREEIAGLQPKLYDAIKQYAQQVGGKCIVYDAANYPYFFIDANCNGAKDTDETAAYNTYTGRLLKAAYNYQVSIKDPGAFAHNAKYIIQLLHDSIVDLNPKISQPINLADAWRVDPGHFDGTALAFRDWDDAGAVPGNCARCHSSEGVPTFLKEGVNISEMPTNGFMCTTCHKSLAPDWTLYTAAKVKFPSGAEVSFTSNPEANLCLLCHQGRESTVSVNVAIAGKDLDTVPTPALSFKNVHYFAAGATLFGGEVKGIYQYDGKTYLGRNLHGPGIATYDACTECHSTHELEVKADKCATCHLGATAATLKDIRGAFGGNTGSNVDYDGDGNKTEGIYFEVDTMAVKLYAAIQLYAKDIAGTQIAYNSAAYPYWFIDTNGNGVADPDESVRANSYNKFTPRLLQAAYNYQYVQKDPGLFAHNPKYVLQAVFDSLESLGTKVTVDMTGMVRP